MISFKKVTMYLALVSAIGIWVPTASAGIQTNVDFSGLDSTVDITYPNNLSLNGITFSYDNQGTETDPLGNPVTAAADSSGIFGNTFGALTFAFDKPANALEFDFSLLSATTTVAGAQDLPDAMIFLYSQGGNLVGFTSVSAAFTPYNAEDDPNLGDAIGHLELNGVEFDQAVMYFANGSEYSAPYFSVGNINYCPVPEPSTCLLLAFGSLLAGGWKLYVRKH